MADDYPFLAADGPLATQIPGFAPRQAQLTMACAVDAAIANQHPLVVEAGTGTGKTFAYLAPLLVRGVRALVSTGTKALQEQLFHRDLPRIVKASGKPVKIALLKGRANYLCHYRLQIALDGTIRLDRQLLDQLTRIQQWLPRTDSGDLAELTALAEDSAALPLVTSTVDNCLGRDCPFIGDCFVAKARAKARDAELVVVNHHLFLADLTLKDTGFGELIPQCDALVFDEAHQLPEIAASWFGETLSSRQLQELAEEVRQLVRTELKEQRQLALVAEALEQRLRDWRLAFAIDPSRGNWRQLSQQPQIAAATALVAEALTLFDNLIRAQIGHHKLLDQLALRSAGHRELWQRLQQTSALGVSLWCETSRRHVMLHLTPLDVAERFGRHISERPASWIFTSATLQVDGRFDHFSQQLGLGEPTTLALDSPFDYPNQALLYVPRYLPEPGPQFRAHHLIDAALPLIEAAAGRTLLLFTSYRMMHEAAQLLLERCDLPLLVQGEAPKRQLLADFVATPEAVLLATASFWEGVDIPGDDLCCVVIDKLPFAAPDEPLIQARIEDCRRRGLDPFAVIQLPAAVLTLKQGAGRLIRDVSDRGVLMVCDNRLVNRPYGRIFMHSLPPMRRSREQAEAVALLQQIPRAVSLPTLEPVPDERTPP